MSLAGRCYYRISESRLGHQLARGVVHTARTLGLFGDFRMPLDSLDLSHAPVRELMRLWQRMHWSSGDGMMPQPELFAMYQLACDCAADGDFVELGAWKGLTTCYLAAACRVRGRGHVFAVDTFAGTRENNTQYAGIAKSGGSTLDEFHRRICKAGHENLVTACVGYTTDVVHQHRDRPIAFLLIDADHSYEGAKADFDSWFPVVVPGGTIVFHDYAMPDAGVRDFVDREVATRSDVRVTPGNIVPNIFAITRAATTQTTTTHTANTHATTAHTTTTDTITTHTIASDATTDTTNSRGAATVVSQGRKPVEETPTSAMSPGRGGR